MTEEMFPVAQQVIVHTRETSALPLVTNSLQCVRLQANALWLQTSKKCVAYLQRDVLKQVQVHKTCGVVAVLKRKEVLCYVPRDYIQVQLRSETKQNPSNIEGH